MLEAQGKAVGHWRMVDAQRRDFQVALLEHVALAEFTDRNQFTNVRPSLVDDADLDVELHRLAEPVPVVTGTGRPEHADRLRKARRPGSVEQRPKLQHMVGMQMRDEDEVKRLQAHTGIHQTSGDTKPAIDDDRSPTEFQQRRTRPRPARPQSRTALRAEKHQPARHGDGAQDQSPSGVPLKRFFRSAQQSM